MELAQNEKKGQQGNGILHPRTKQFLNVKNY